ncbi:conjugative transfer ATPase [Vibrio sp. PNB22_3_1]
MGSILNAGIAFLGKKKFFSKKDMEAMYQRNMPSYSSKLPYAGYCKQSETFILEDLYSRATVLTLGVAPTEGRSSDYLRRVRDAIEDMYDIFDPKTNSAGQWVIQEFSYDATSVEDVLKKMKDYVLPHAKGTKFTEEYLRMMRHHLMGLSQAEDGLFVDKEVTGEPWRLKIPCTKMVIYRRVSSSEASAIGQGKFDAARELNQIVEEIKIKFSQVGVAVEKDPFEGVFEWLYRLFNPNPDLDSGEVKEHHYRRVSDVDPDVMGASMSEFLLGDFPRSSVEDNCWYFNGKPTRFIRYSGLKKAPRIGQLTGEVTSGESASSVTRCVLDSLPSGCMLAKTVVITTQGEFEMRLAKVGAAAKSSTPGAQRAREALRTAEEQGGVAKKVLCTMGVYISGDDLGDLEEKQRKVITVFNNNNVRLFKDDVDGLSLDAHSIHLPMNFRPLADTKRHYLRTMFAQHCANLSFSFGRSVGSGNPVHTYFNRGGSPLFFDSFNSSEKSMNSFGLLLGSPGAGKSASLVADCYSVLAMRRPRLFIIEYGNSFSVAAKDWRKKGLTVEEYILSASKCPSLAPFASIDKVLDLPLGNIDLPDDEDDSGDDDTDYLGELELLAMMIITGSEEKEEERYNRGDRSLLRRALVQTAQRNRDLGMKESGKPRPTITADVMETLKLMATSKEEALSDVQRDKLLEMAQSLEGYTSGFNAKLFNRPGEEFPDVDVLVINLATLAQDNNRDKLNVAYTALSQYINNLAEKTQYEARDIVVYTDEAHLLLQNSMLARLIIKQIKTARKLGVWPTLCTQNIEDIQGDASKLLSMIEWYRCLNTTISEAEIIAKFKSLTPEQITLMTSTKKMARCYTEGVVISQTNQYQFRVVPPSLVLAVAMTESSEKAEREAIRKEMGFETELEAAYEVARRLDKARGIVGELEYETV